MKKKTQFRIKNTIYFKLSLVAVFILIVLSTFHIIDFSGMLHSSFVRSILGVVCMLLSLMFFSAFFIGKGYDAYAHAKFPFTNIFSGKNKTTLLKRINALLGGILLFIFGLILILFSV